MRILSQKGTTDLPYEMVGVSINAHDNCVIIAYGMDSIEDSYWEMAIYSTSEKTQKAMEMLRKAYSPILVIQEQENGMDPNIKPNNWLIATALPAQRIEVMDNFYFQFPADDEIEVSE